MIMPLIAAPLTRKGKKGSIPLDIGLSSEAPVVGGVVGPLGPAGTLGDAFSGAALADAAAGGANLAERPQAKRPLKARPRVVGVLCGAAGSHHVVGAHSGPGTGRCRRGAAATAEEFGNR